MFGLALILFLFVRYILILASPFIALAFMPNRRSLAALALLIAGALAALFPHTRRPSCDEYAGFALKLPWLSDIGFWAFGLYACAFGFTVRWGTLRLRDGGIGTRPGRALIHLVSFILLLASPIAFNSVTAAGGVPALFCKPFDER